MSPAHEPDDPVQRGSERVLTGRITCAYLRHNPLPAGDLPALIQTIHVALLACRGARSVPEPALPRPAVPIGKSVTAEFLICLEDGHKCKILTRYLRTRYRMTPDEYRRKWGLPSDYPMAAPRYAARRSQLAKQHGLGRKTTPPGRGT